jgi:hypothetical protein
MRLDTGGYSFFVDQDADEHQFLVKLKFNDQFLGFLAIGVAAKYLEMNPDFGIRLQNAADEFASLLHRWRWVRSQRSGQSSLLGRLTSMPEEEPFRQLGRANDLLETRLDRLETASESSDTACAIYDVFGQLLFMNGCLAQLVKEQGVAPRETSALDLLCLLTGRDFNSCRKLLQEVAEDKRSSSMQMNFGNSSRVFKLNLRPLQLPYRGRTFGAVANRPSWGVQRVRQQETVDEATRPCCPRICTARPR